MKNSWQILTMLLAVALVIMAIKIPSFREPEVITEQVDASEIIYNSIMTRSSVRSYTDQPVEQEKLEKLLRAGMAAPTAGNRQPWEFIIVTDRKILDTFPSIIPNAQMSAKAQAAIVVLGSPTKALLPEYWVQDCSAATENILLAAHGMGLGTVWCGAYPNNDADRVGQMRKLLSIPEDSYALNIIVIGYPDSEPVIKDKWDTAKVHYNKY